MKRRDSAPHQQQRVKREPDEEEAHTQRRSQKHKKGEA